MIPVANAGDVRAEVIGALLVLAGVGALAILLVSRLTEPLQPPRR